MLKKLLSIVLILAMLFSTIPLATMASEVKETPADTFMQEAVSLEESDSAKIFDQFSDVEAVPPEQLEEVTVPETPSADIENDAEQKNNDLAVATEVTCGLNVSYTFYSDGRLNIYCIDKTLPGEITTSAFFSNTKITSLSIGVGITKIGAYAFKNCENLRTISIPNSVVSIGEEAFYNCYYMNMDSLPTGLKEIDALAFYKCFNLTVKSLPESIVFMGVGAFQGCSGVGFTSLPKGITVLSDRIFSGCHSLAITEIQNGVTSIGNRAFSECTSIRSLVIPESVKSIGDDAFGGNSIYMCHDMELVFQGKDSIIHGYTNSVFFCRPDSNITIFVVPSLYDSYINRWGQADTIRFVAGLPGSKKITVELGDSILVSALGDVSGESMYFIPGETVTLTASPKAGLENKYLFSGWTSADMDLSFSMSNIITFIMPENGITITANFEEIIPGAHGGCGTNIKWKVTSDYALHLIGAGPMIDYSDEEAPWGPYRNIIKSIVMDSRINTIGDNAFLGLTVLTSATLPAGLLSIGTAAFSGCKNLVLPILPTTVSYIAPRAFYGCKSLGLTALPDGTQIIREETFSGSFIDMTKLPETVTVIENKAFKDAYAGKLQYLPSNLKKIGIQAFSSTSVSFQLLPDSVTEIGGGAFANCKVLALRRLPTQLTRIDSEAFLNCEKLALTQLPSGVTLIGANAFNGCTNLALTSLPNNVTTIGDFAFSYCNNLCLKALPYPVTYIGQYAFYWCEKTSFSWLPPQLKEIGSSAFSVSPDQNEGTLLNITSLPKTLVSIGDHVFKNCYSLSDTSLPAGLKKIGNAAFANCFRLNIEGLPSELTYIGNSAFMGCSRVWLDILPNGLTYLGKSAFENCPRVSPTELPNEITYINDKVFKNSGVSSMTLSNNITGIGEEAFYGCKNLNSLVIPAAIKKINISAFSECNLSDGITLLNTNNIVQVDPINKDFYTRPINIFVAAALYSTYTKDANWKKFLDNSFINLYSIETHALTTDSINGTTTARGGMTGLGAAFKVGETVKLNALPDEGYKFAGWESPDVTFSNAISAAVTFTMPNSPVHVIAHFTETVRPITSLVLHAPLNVNHGTHLAAVQSQLEAEHPTVTVTLDDESTTELPVVWDVSGSNYDGTKPDTYTIYGDIDLTNKPITNPDSLRAQIEVKVLGPTKFPIISILSIQQDVGQNIWLTPTDKVNAFGVPTTMALPENVTVQLGSGDMAQLPVVWDKSGYDSALVGKQTLTGEVVIAEGSEITNPDGLRASLEITVLPKEYEVWDASPKEITLEVLPGTTVAQLNEKLKAEGKAELSVQAIDLSNDFEVITFCNLTLAEEDCAGYSKDVPGLYALTARISSNFTPLAEDIPGPIVVKVTVLEPLVITAVESARMDAYQSVAPEHLDNIPAQVNVTLEGGMVIPVDVEWNWAEYKLAKDTVGDHIVLGKLVNLPSLAKQPEGEEFKANMVVATTPVDYVVSGVLSDNLFNGDGGLTLEELTAALKPTLNLQITSVTDGITLTTEYLVNVTLEQEKNPDFDPEYADFYTLTGTLGLPTNITCPIGKLYERIRLQTNSVEVLSVEPVYALTTEGTAFNEIEGLPTQVSATLSCVGADGQNKKILIDADWGTGEGYDPFPPDLTDDNSVTMEVTGELANWPQYVNGAGVSTTLFVTMTRVFDVVAIAPNRFPATGAMEVKLGSNLEDIYNLLDSHSVQLTLENPKGETSTVDVTFTLREEDNPDYNPMTEGTYTLKAHLPLTEKLLNPDSLGVEIIVKTTKYSITSTKAVRVAGVLSGTPFAEVGLPTLATIARNDGKEEDIPVTWNGSAYNPTKIGSQVVRGTLTTPLPVHLENPNNRQPSAVVTIINPAVQILSMTQMTGVPKLMDNGREDDAVPGFVEYRYVAELLHQDGTVTTEIISVFVETE